jgi:hypothetical protein
MLKGAEQMSISDFSRYALGFCAALAILAGCGSGAQSQLAPSGSFQQSSAQARLGQLAAGLANAYKSGVAQTGVVALHPDRSPSWMAPDATTKDLLYVSSYDNGTVSVYSYPQDKVVGKLTGFAEPDGMCTDNKGDVWITNNGPEQSGYNVVEYKHGGTKQIGSVSNPDLYPVSCSVDPTTGNLAVGDSETYGDTQGAVAIYTHAKGSPTYYTVPNMTIVYWCGYDDKGNLYADGFQNYTGTGFEFAELPKGKKTFTDITLTGGAIHYPGNVRWDGKYVAVGDQQYQLVSGEWDSGIYQTTGAGGKIVGATALGGSHDVPGFTIEGKTVIGPDRSPYSYATPNDVGFWDYLAGGKPTKTLQNKAFDQPDGSAVSEAQ